MKKKHLKICLISSSGGHFAQLKQIIPITESHEMFIITEKNNSTISSSDKYNTYFLSQQERKNWRFMWSFSMNILKSIRIFVEEKPDVVISTGAGAVIPFCVISKLFGKKIIFLESFAKINSPTITGKIVYKFADKFFVQWEEMKKFYPKAIYKGGIY